MPSDESDDDKLYKSAIRRAFSRSKLNKRVRNKAVSPDITGPRGGKYLICAECGEAFPPSQCEVDHMVEVTALYMPAKEQDVVDYYNRVRCDEDNLQVLCRECHSKISKKENEVRKTAKKMRDKGVDESEIKDYTNKELNKLKGVEDG